MDQGELFGRVIKVAQARPQKDANEGLGSKTAVWEQVNLPLKFLIWIAYTDWYGRRVI